MHLRKKVRLCGKSIELRKKCGPLDKCEKLHNTCNMH